MATSASHDLGDEKTLRQRTKSLALRIVKMTEALPDKPAGWVIGKQILRSGTAVGANYRSTCRARSDKDFLARMGIVEEELDETIYWLELITEAELLPEKRLVELRTEAEELLKMVAASIITVKKRLKSIQASAKTSRL